MGGKTTIQVDEEIVRLLESLKKERGLKSYSEALREMLKEGKTLKKSERGSLPKLKRLARKKTDRFD